MLIELAQEHDIPTVLALVEELLTELGDEGQEFAWIDRDKLQVDLEKNLGSGRFLPLLAREETGTPIGVLTLSVSFALYAGGEYGVIDEMYVKPAFRGRGVGAALVDEAVSIARQRQWFRLDVTSPENGSAAEFYEHLGFEFTGPKLRLLVHS